MTEQFPGQLHADDDPRVRVHRELPATSARAGAFTDAVVAIALTLLILPLMEAVPEAGGEEGLTTAAFVHEHAAQLISFLTSFAVIGMFWTIHHRVYRADTPHTGRSGTVNFAWMLTIVFLPIATALTGAMHTDRLQILLYEGTMALSAWLLLVLSALQLDTRRKAGLATPNRTLLATPLAIALLFTVVLVIGLSIPQLSYLPLFAMFVTGPLRGLLVRRLHD